MRIGHGYDVHKLVKERKLFLGGIEIPHDMGLLGHSDADVLLHAIMDSIIGAMALGDIGKHFSDTDEKYYNIDSKILLKEVSKMLKENGYEIGNIDATIVAQKPKLAKYIPDMVEIVANILECEKNQVNIKATTEEHLGFTGNCEGISAHSVCIIL